MSWLQSLQLEPCLGYNRYSWNHVLVTTATAGTMSWLQLLQQEPCLGYNCYSGNDILHFSLGLWRSQQLPPQVLQFRTSVSIIRQSLLTNFCHENEPSGLSVRSICSVLNLPWGRGYQGENDLNTRNTLLWLYCEENRYVVIVLPSWTLGGGGGGGVHHVHATLHWQMQFTGWTDCIWVLIYLFLYYHGTWAATHCLQRIYLNFCACCYARSLSWLKTVPG